MNPVDNTPHMEQAPQSRNTKPSKKWFIPFWVWIVLPLNGLFASIGTGVGQLLTRPDIAQKITDFPGLSSGQQIELAAKILRHGVGLLIYPYFSAAPAFFIAYPPYTLFYAVFTYALFIWSCSAWGKRQNVWTFIGTIVTSAFFFGLPSLFVGIFFYSIIAPR